MVYIGLTNHGPGMAEVGGILSVALTNIFSLSKTILVFKPKNMLSCHKQTLRFKITKD